MDNPQPVVQQTFLKIDFPVTRISCTKCKSSFAIIAFAGNIWFHQKPIPGSPIYCPFCKMEINEC